MSAGTSWIFLRGLMRDSRHWGGFPQIFAARNPGVRVELLDFPGNGVLNAARSAGSIEAMAEYCRAELMRRDLAPPYCLLALSLGAMVAASWGARHPQELQACVLINTSLRPFSPPHWRLRPLAWPSILRLALKSPGPRAIEETILRMTTAKTVEQESLLEDWTKWRIANPVSKTNALRQLAAAALFRASTAPPAARLLILCGGKDRLVDNRCSRRLADRWDCDIALHPEAGHDLPLDDGPWVAERVRQWMQDN